MHNYNKPKFNRSLKLLGATVATVSLTFMLAPFMWDAFGTVPFLALAANWES